MAQDGPKCRFLQYGSSLQPGLEQYCLTQPGLGFFELLWTGGGASGPTADIFRLSHPIITEFGMKIVPHISIKKINSKWHLLSWLLDDVITKIKFSSKMFKNDQF